MFSKLTTLALAGAASLTAFGASAQAQQSNQAPQSDQAQQANLTQTCAYKDGPLSGQTIDYSGAPGASAVRVGNRCADMHGSSGWAVAQQPGREQGGRFYMSPGAPNAWDSSGAPKSGYSLFCRFDSGPAAGHTSDYSSTLGAQPVAVGSACSDGPNKGVAVAHHGQ